jgi:hypothetical protein
MTGRPCIWGCCCSPKEQAGSLSGKATSKQSWLIIIVQSFHNKYALNKQRLLTRDYNWFRSKIPSSNGLKTLKYFLKSKTKSILTITFLTNIYLLVFNDLCSFAICLATLSHFTATTIIRSVQKNGRFL